MKEYRESVTDNFLELESLDKDEFLTLKETLTRIGVPAYPKTENEKPILFQTAHVFHSLGKYYLVHFKQMFLLDGRVKSTKITEEDMNRLYSIGFLVQKWGLAKFVEPLPRSTVRVKVVPYQDKFDWQLKAKYDIGEKKGNDNYD